MITNSNTILILGHITGNDGELDIWKSNGAYKLGLSKMIENNPLTYDEMVSKRYLTVEFNDINDIIQLLQKAKDSILNT